MMKIKLSKMKKFERDKKSGILWHIPLKILILPERAHSATLLHKDSSPIMSSWSYLPSEVAGPGPGD